MQSAKGVVDIVDLSSAHNTTRMKIKRWLLNTFVFLLSATRTNIKTILSELQLHVKLSNFEFAYLLGEIIVLPNIDRKYSTFNGLTTDLVKHMHWSIPRTGTKSWQGKRWFPCLHRKYCGYTKLQEWSQVNESPIEIRMCKVSRICL